MIPAAQVNVELNQGQIRKFIEEEVQKQINQQLLLVDVERLVQLTSMSKRFLEEYILSDVRVRQHERRRARKKFYIYEPTMKAILDIVNEW